MLTLALQINRAYIVGNITNTKWMHKVYLFDYYLLICIGTWIHSITFNVLYHCQIFTCIAIGRGGDDEFGDTIRIFAGPGKEKKWKWK